MMVQEVLDFDWFNFQEIIQFVTIRFQFQLRMLFVPHNNPLFDSYFHQIYVNETGRRWMIFKVDRYQSVPV